MDATEKELRWQLRLERKRIEYMRRALHWIIGGEQEGDADKDIAFNALEADTRLADRGYEHEEKAKAKGIKVT